MAKLMKGTEDSIDQLRKYISPYLFDEWRAILMTLPNRYLYEIQYDCREHMRHQPPMKCFCGCKKKIKITSYLTRKGHLSKFQLSQIHKHVAEVFIHTDCKFLDHLIMLGITKDYGRAKMAG
jgi:hypothetical protein